VSLTRQQVIDEAMRLVDANGLDALALRGLADRLGVRAPTLYWHVRNKAELLDALGDAIMDNALDAVPNSDPDGDWREWLLAALIELRRAMLAHPDGARIVSGARHSLRRADFSERAMSTLVDHGLVLQRARMVVLAAERYTVGYVLEEQAPGPEPDQQGPDHEGVDPIELQRRLPTVTRAIIEYFSAGHTADDLYRDGVRLILGLPPGS
jgi:TetR/AcrR family transcriptional regulator, tetracycline repressor protein